MSTPRVVFMGGDGQAPRESGSVAIPEQREAVSDAPKVRRPWVLWRLLSSNNRELGRSQMLHADHAMSVEDLLHLKRNIERVEPVITHAEYGVEWHWALLLDGAQVARSSRGYERLRECHYSLEQFLTALPSAAVLDDPARMVRQRREHAIPGTFTPLPRADAL